MNTCYRHPDRETGVSCQRCDRYICPECSTPGAVGYLCPEDSAQKQKIQVPVYQQSLLRRAPVTVTLIGLNVAIYLLQLLDGTLTEALFYAKVGDNYSYGSIVRAFTSGFAHSPVQYTHILFNMYSLFVLGTLLEPMLGKLRFSLLYLFSLFAGTLGFLFFANLGASVVGASGAIFGLMGAYLVLLRALKMDSRQLVMLVLINLFLSFLPGIAWQAHIGGFIGGAAVALIYVYFRNTKSKNVVYLALLALAVVMGVLWVAGNSLVPLIVQ